MLNVCRSQDEFASFIKTWISGALISPCLAELNSDAPEDIVEYIPRNGLPHPYCNGQRKVIKHVFDNGLPKMLPINLERLADIGSVPKQIQILSNKRYELIGLTCHVRDSHFVAFIYRDGKEYIYDGLTAHPHIEEGKFNEPFEMQHALYILIDIEE